jgi:hypothetical protein
MPTIIDDTKQILMSMGLRVGPVATPPGFTGLQVDLPNDAQGFFVWERIDGDDYIFRIARFWASDNPFSMMASPTLIDAVRQTRVFATNK